ncbi:MAG: type II toxin-antitoxin system RatA family toxin [Pseudomonas sp.]|jgi:ribosome-associated toxin RatA of RatAB toxin-antitoxin module|uniref:type II toxin-antitoxin system RatA family toxin n=1 Tax=Halopseudomonas TaxID=2901189 RepID=UPI001B79763B|nr:type II toxin-antitoxin system RatA family toxin [Pseudomonas sp.]MBQ0778034.1 type II toxin-antitoxin system RatA family toxin [Pseudomonas sp.]WOD10896.1 type II toxin-antitoxin system RatA family toxin [Pseudomonas sp. NyZ704]
MTHIQRSALLPYPAQRLFDLVNRVERYPEFLPWCAKAEILSETDTQMRARLTVAKAGLTQSFTTNNTLVPGQRIELRLEDGPFSDLHGVWEFKALGEHACKISLDLHFSYAGPVVKATLGPLFNQAANNMVEAFCQRAKELYGNG